MVICLLLKFILENGSAGIWKLLTKIVRYSSGEAEKERRPQQKKVTFIQARRGDSQPNYQAERRKGSGRLHTYREVCGSDKGNVNQVGYFEYSFVEMTLVVGQGVISLLGGWRGW